MKTESVVVETTNPNTRAARSSNVCVTRLLALLLVLALPTAVHALSYTNSYGIWTYTANGGGITITRYTGSGGAVTIPSTIPNFNNWPVISIGENAFGETSLTSVTIPTNVTSIGDTAFADTGLTGVTIPQYVTSIGAAVFSGCASLTGITVNASNPAYGSADGVLFAFDSVGGIIYDPAVLTLIQYPGGKAGGYTISNNVISIADGAFESCSSLTSVTIPNSVTNIGDKAFSYSGLKSVTIPYSVSSIGTEVFYYCTSLTNVTLANGVTSIGYGEFANCGGLQSSIIVPNSVTNIGDYAFYDCNSLESVYFLGSAPSLGSDVFSTDFGLDPATIYYMPATTGWGTTFGGLPAVLWNPQAQNLGVQANQFGFTITGSSNLVLVVEACTNLVNPTWVPVATNTLTGGSSYFSDPQWANYPARFYRLRSP